LIKQKQLYRHNPEQGEFGDCHRTAIACLLDLKPEEVPNFGVHHADINKFFLMCDEFLRDAGYVSVDVWLDGKLTPQEALNALQPDVYYLFCGQSRSGYNHTVIATQGEIAWDPSLDDTGIIGPCDNGYYGFTLLVPLQFATGKPRI